MRRKPVKQLAVFIENRAGRLAEICGILGKANINILGFSIADSEGYGIFRIIVKETDLAQRILREAGFTVTEREILCLDVPHRPGGLSSVLKIFSDNNINVEYMYAIANTLIVFYIESIKEAEEILSKNNIDLKSIDDL